MRPDDINPRTGLVVALVSVFLVFGFMFTVSGIKGETLGDIPLLALGPAICLPGIAAIALTRKTDGCTKWPGGDNRSCPPPGGGGGIWCCCCWCCCCVRNKKPSDKEVLELLRTPSDLESGRGSCDELAKKAYDAAAEPNKGEAGRQGGESLEPKADQEEMVRYLENCYPAMPGNVFVAEATPYNDHSQSALEEKRRESPAVEGSDAAVTAAAAEEEEDNTFAAPPGHSIIVCSYKEENSPYDRYCCYINPSEEICSDHEAVV